MVHASINQPQKTEKFTNFREFAEILPFTTSRRELQPIAESLLEFIPAEYWALECTKTKFFPLNLPKEASETREVEDEEKRAPSKTE